MFGIWDRITNFCLKNFHLFDVYKSFHYYFKKKSGILLLGRNECSNVESPMFRHELSNGI
ncbi:hypothetical protein NRIC_34770 [Enterococcus florum]|uniref:Uncharacterized protein n=1 Tax=Enterococcus florum TaxID=2480627 RepID=A0A4P5PCL9_9ENTE|nr:hypothetical protein NRIC_34770 [Enterococcus florum]